jgi:hypothetical protein
MNAMTMLGDDVLADVAGGCHKHHHKPKHCHKPHDGGDYYSSTSQSQNQSVDIFGNLVVTDGSTVTINFGNQSQSA